MKQYSLLLWIVLTGMFAHSQTLDEGKTLFKNGRLKSAEELFTKLVTNNPADVEANYWLGQLYINKRQKDKAKELYTKALVATNQNPLIVVGIGHLEMLEGKKEEAKAKFEAVLAPTKNKKNKNFGDVVLLKAIGRANATGESSVGDLLYGIEKLNQAAQLDLTDPNIFIDMGLTHLKRGGEFGGDAKKAFENAIERAPNNGVAYYRIGKIFESQRNQELLLEYYNKSVAMDAGFASGFLALYEFYQNKDVNRAKDYLDKYIATHDKDLETEFFMGDYLFRAGKYQESLQKGLEIEKSLAPDEKFEKVFKLKALNYDRLGDSVQARDNMEKFISLREKTEIDGDDYAAMASYYLKFPGMESKADNIVEQAIALDTSVTNKISYIKAIAGAYEARKDYANQYNWVKKLNQLKPDSSARNYFIYSDLAYKAKDFQNAEKIATEYVNHFPDQPQGYILRRRAAVAADPDTSAGTALSAIDLQLGFLNRDPVANKGRILENNGYKIFYFLVKSKEYDKALESANAILAIDPTNQYGLAAKSEAERLIKATQGKGTAPVAPKPANGSPAKTQ